MGLLYFQPMHGYDLHRFLEANLGEIWRMSQSQVYATLKRLEKKGLVIATRQPQEKRPDRSCFALTESGRTRFESWLFTPTPSSAHLIRVEFITRLFFTSQMGEDVRSQVLQEQAAAIHLDLDLLQKRLGALAPDQVFNRLGLELRLRQLLSISEWLSTCELSLSE